MNKEFVPYEQALALKELGFDEPCFGYYYTTNGKDWQFAEKSEYYRLDDEINIGSKFSLLAPTFSQAFRWFREKYDLYHFITREVGINTSDILFVASCYKGKKGNSPKRTSIPSKTYEEAELACLQKLIKLVKQK